MSKSQFPSIGLLDFTTWCYDVKILDDKTVTISKLDLAWKAANSHVNSDDINNPSNGLTRFEFLEILVRLSLNKFKDTGVEKQASGAVAKLIKQCVLKFDKSDEWQEFRDKHLWTVPVNDLMEANLEGLRKVYDSHLMPRKKTMDVKDSVELFYKKTGLLS